MACLSRFKHFLRGGHTLARREDGAAAVEFALTFPVYLTMIMMVVEFGRLAFTQVLVSHAAEEATRYALVHYNATTDEVQNVARDSLSLIDPNNLTAIIVTAPTDDTDQTRMFTVEINYSFEPLLPIDKFIKSDNAAGFTISGASRGFITQEIPTI